MRSDRDEVKQGLKDRIVDLCAKLLPDGRLEGRLWVAHDPVMGDYSQTPELKVAVTGDVGAWICWRCQAKGDVIRLVEYCLSTDFRGAMDFARDFLGLKTMSREARADYSRQAEERRLAAVQEAKNREMDRRQAVRRLWDSGTPIGEASAAASIAARYFDEGRGCPLEAVPRLEEGTFRVVPSLEWWKGARYEIVGGRRRKVAPGPRFTALLAAFTDAERAVTAVHCTFLHPDRAEKAPVSQPKLMFGTALGSVIRVQRALVSPCPLVLCEGVEDGATLAIGVPEAMVWAGGSLVGMGGAPVWLPEISAVYVAADNDWKSRTAEMQLGQVLEALEAHGKPIEAMRSAVGKDFNDGMKE